MLIILNILPRKNIFDASTELEWLTIKWCRVFLKQSDWAEPSEIAGCFDLQKRQFPTLPFVYIGASGAL